jgi:hypothetical protein
MGGPPDYCCLWLDVFLQNLSCIPPFPENFWTYPYGCNRGSFDCYRRGNVELCFCLHFLGSEDFAASGSATEKTVCGYSWMGCICTHWTGLSDLVAVGAFRGGLALHPINWLVHITLANNRSAPTTIIGLWAETMRPTGTVNNIKIQWDELRNVPLRRERLFHIAAGLAKADELSAQDALESHLIDQTIPPSGTVSGWAAWFCPDSACGGTAKLIIQESNGERSETNPFPFSSTTANLEDWIPEPLGIAVDLTQPRIPIGSTCDRPGTTGLMFLVPHNGDVKRPDE